MDVANLWEPMVRLFKMGCLPIGFVKDEFVVYCPKAK
jgi:hypothetical protein